MNTRSVIAFTFIGLAVIGLVSMLLNSPGALFKQIAFMVIGVAVLFFIFRLVMRKRIGASPEDRAFAKAAKQSKKRYNTQQSVSKKPASVFSKKKQTRKKTPRHLKVIEGKKGKKLS